MLTDLLMAIAVVGLAAYAAEKHFTLAQIKTDLQAAVTKADATVATIKTDLLKYL
jgi:hypothetical protein